MARLAIAVACGVLALGSAAHAQVASGISNIQSSASSTVFLPNSDGQTISEVNGVGQEAGVATNTRFGSAGSSFNSFVHVGATAITFESANTVLNTDTSSSSSVSFNVHNSNPNADLPPPTFHSTITAAGLGFYLADTNANGGNCLYTGCPQATGPGATFGQLTGGALPDVGFTFTVTSSTSVTPLYRLTGELSINADGLVDGLGSIGGICISSLCPSTGPRGLLDGFRTTVGDNFNPEAGIGAASGIGYAWNATGIDFNIASVADQTLTYTTTVFSNSGQDCIGSTGVCLVAYSGFGDPVGAAGAVDASFGAFRGFNFQAPSPCTPGLICGLEFGPTTLALPTFDGVNGSFATAPIPEPATWSMMIAGFGLLGAALRRRRVLAYN